MNKKYHIAILFHEADDAESARGYVVTFLADIWREQGHKVTFLFGVDQFVPADLLFMHIDLSVVPEEYREFAERYENVVNKNALDIRKSSFSHNLLQKNDDYDGWVIVKADLNCGGRPELDRGVVTRGDGPMSSTAYRVYRSIKDIPEAIFDMPEIIVEKFFPQYKDGLYHMYVYRFFGTRGSCTKLSSKSPIIKSHNIEHSIVVKPPPFLEQFRRSVGFDYGKFDFVVYQRHPIVFDRNKTIGVGNLSSDPATLKARRYRADAIYEFLPQ